MKDTKGHNKMPNIETTTQEEAAELALDKHPRVRRTAQDPLCPPGRPNVDLIAGAHVEEGNLR